MLIDIKYAGICHSEIHTVKGDWGPQQYPLVPGHEIVGFVAEVGPDVTTHQDGKRFGADHYFASGDPETFTRLASSFDFILNTVSAEIDPDAYLSLLYLDCTMVNVGAPPTALPVTPLTLIGTRRSFAGSQIGGIRETQEMLDFCAGHGLNAVTELIGAEQIDEAYERVMTSQVRYCAVIDTSTLG